MRVLITGSQGFVGQALTRKLAAKGHIVVGLDAAAADEISDDTPLQHYTSSGVHVRWDMADGDTLWRVMKALAPTWIFHLAATSDLKACENDPKHAIEVNFGGTANLLLAAAEYWLDYKPAGFRLVLAGSGEEYGEGEPERWAATKPRNIYGATKAAAASLAIGFWHSAGLPVSIARMATIYGPGQRGKFIPTAIDKLRRGEELALHNGGNSRRDWLYIDDALDGLIAVAELGSSGEAYNLGGSTETTTGVTALLIACLLEDRGHPTERSKIARVEGGGLSARIKMNCSDTVFQLRWSPAVSLVTGLERTVDAALHAQQPASTPTDVRT